MREPERFSRLAANFDGDFMDLDKLFEKFETQTQKDLKLNFGKFFTDSSLSPKDAGLLVLACAESLNCRPLKEFAIVHLQSNGATPEEIAEARDCAAIMGLNNIFFRFRHFVAKETYQKPAGLRMNVLARPVMGKGTFELLALAVSALNGCEACVKAHEVSVLTHGISEDTIYDAMRLTAVIKGLEVSFRQIG